MLSFQLIHGSLLQITIDRQAHVFVALKLDRLSFNYLPRFWQGSALNTKERAFQARVSPVGTENMRHGFVHRIVSIDVAAGVATIKRQRVFEFAAAVKYPAAQG